MKATTKKLPEAARASQAKSTTDKSNGVHFLVPQPEPYECGWFNSWCARVRSGSAHGDAAAIHRNAEPRYATEPGIFDAT